MERNQLSEPAAAQAAPHWALQQVDVRTAVALYQSRSIGRDRDVPSDDGTVGAGAMRLDGERPDLLPGGQRAALDLAAGVGMGVEPSEAGIVSKVAGAAELAGIEVHFRGHSPGMDIVDRDVAADRHAKYGRHHFRVTLLVEARHDARGAQRPVAEVGNIG